MSTSAATNDRVRRDDLPARGKESASRLHRLEQAINHAAHLLPAQGPITVFIHHNTLHAFEELKRLTVQGVPFADRTPQVEGGITAEVSVTAASLVQGELEFPLYPDPDLPEQGGGSRDTLFIDMRPACVEEVLPRLLDPSRKPPARRG